MAAVNEWINAEHATAYLGRADRIPHRTEGEATLLELLPTVKRVLDLGSGDGRLLGLVLNKFPDAKAVALDFSPTMLERLRARFALSPNVSVTEHNLDYPLPGLGEFDAVVSSFAIHHCTHERKRRLYEEIFRLLTPGGVFCNLEHVASPTAKLHADFLTSIGYTPETEDPSNQLLDPHSQLQWLNSIGYKDVDCFWKWRELALLAGTKLHDSKPAAKS
jgi:SAM-dependent methyltransferase